MCVSFNKKALLLFPAVPRQVVLLLAIRDTLSCGQTACLEAVYQIKRHLQKDGLPPYDQPTCDFFFLPSSTNYDTLVISHGNAG